MSETTAAPDVKIQLNQMVLPEDFDVDELGLIARRVAETGVQAAADVAPGSAPRDIEAITQSLFVLQFFTAHGADIAVGVTASAFWDAIKSVAKRLRGAHPAGGATIGVQYANGNVVTVELDDASQIQQVLHELRAAASSSND